MDLKPDLKPDLPSDLPPADRPPCGPYPHNPAWARARARDDLKKEIEELASLLKGIGPQGVPAGSQKLLLGAKLMVLLALLQSDESIEVTPEHFAPLDNDSRRMALLSFCGVLMHVLAEES
jgi:hypothetical protein